VTLDRIFRLTSNVALGIWFLGEFLDIFVLDPDDLERGAAAKSAYVARQHLFSRIQIASALLFIGCWVVSAILKRRRNRG
jgi:hypothetical protein